MARIGFPTAVLVTAAVLINSAAAFVPSSVQVAAVGAESSAASAGALGMADTDAFDVVKVDLDDGRDYPIYIGAEFDKAEGVYVFFVEYRFCMHGEVPMSDDC